MGVSRGGEAALLLGATYPNLIDGEIAGVPSAYVVPSPDNVATPAWTLHGRPVPHLAGAQLLATTDRIPVHAPSAEIAVERIRGPILLTCGGDDQIWPSCTFTVQDFTSSTDGYTGGTVNATEPAWANNTQHLLALLGIQHSPIAQTHWSPRSQRCVHTSRTAVVIERASRSSAAHSRYDVVRWARHRPSGLSGRVDLGVPDAVHRTAVDASVHGDVALPIRHALDRPKVEFLILQVGLDVQVPTGDPDPPA